MALLRLVNRLSNMLMLFIPIKVFIVISSGHELSSLVKINEYLGYDTTLVVLMLLITLVFSTSILTQFYFPKALAKQSEKFRGVTEIKVNELTYVRPFITKTYAHLVNFVSDFIIIIVSFGLYFYSSFEFAFVQSLFVFFFYMTIDYVIFTDNRYGLPESLSIKVPDFIALSSSLILIFSLLLVFFIYANNQLEIHSGVLILMVTRLVVASVRGMTNSAVRINSNIETFNEKQV